MHGTEKAAQHLERKGFHEKGEKLRQDVSQILHTAVDNPQQQRSNLTTTEQKGLNIVQEKIKNEEIAVAPHDKGIGFVIQKPEILKAKAKAAFQNVTSDTPDRTKTLEGAIQCKLLKLKKEGKTHTKAKIHQV